MSTEIDELLARQQGVATSGQLLSLLSRRTLAALLQAGELGQVWPGVYGRGEIDDTLRLRGLDLRAGEPVATCLDTAAAMFGFDTEGSTGLHILSPVGRQLRPSSGLYVHRRDGAPLVSIEGRLATAPDWTALEVARGLRRPRALATLDAALRSGTCTATGLGRAAHRQAGRRGIVAARELLPLATPLAESPMESESRLIMIDGGLPEPLLQFEIVDRTGRCWRLDFAWPDARVAVEYDGFDWHSDRQAFQRDRQKRAALQELGWQLLSLVTDDVRRTPTQTVDRIGTALDRRRAA